MPTRRQTIRRLRNNRHERRLRLGVGFPVPDLVFDHGDSKAASSLPVTQSDVEGPVVFVYREEFFGNYDTPIAKFFDDNTTPGVRLMTNNTGRFRIIDENNNFLINFRMDKEVPPDGTHTLGAYVNPTTGDLALYVDGRLLGTDTASLTQWGDLTSTWSFLNGGVSGDHPLHFLEIHPGVKPAGFVE